MKRYHYSTWGNGPNTNRLVEDSLEECRTRICHYPHAIVATQDEFDAILERATVGGYDGAAERWEINEP